MRRPLEDMPRCPRCGGILNNPRFETGRYVEQAGVTYIVTTKHTFCPWCETHNTTEHWRLSFVRNAETERGR